MAEQRLTRANTVAGSPERKQVYAREYAARQQRALEQGVSYAQQRQLKRLWPLSAKTKQELKRNGVGQSRAHTRYAVIRAQLAQEQLAQGEKLSARQLRSARILGSAAETAHPLQDLASWYRNAYGNDYNASDFPGLSAAPTGAGLQGLPWEEEPEELYDVEWDDLEGWDLWEFIERDNETP